MTTLQSEHQSQLKVVNGQTQVKLLEKDNEINLLEAQLKHAFETVESAVTGLSSKRARAEDMTNCHCLSSYPDPAAPGAAVSISVTLLSIFYWCGYDSTATPATDSLEGSWSYDDVSARSE